MADILVQFHTLPEELLPVVERFVADLRLHVVAMKYRPFEATEIGPARLEGVFADCSYRRLAFTVGKPSLPATSTLKFDDQNPDRLTIDLGRRTEKGLNESSLAARSFAPEIIAVWKQLAKRLKAMTVAGAVAVDKATGATARLREHRFTQGAKELELRGVPIITLTGIPLKLGDVR